MKLIQPLFSGSIDVIGDIHGEYNALTRLVQRCLDIQRLASIRLEGDWSSLVTL